SGQGGQSVGPEVEGTDGGPFGGEGEGHLPADAAAGAGNEDDAIGEFGDGQTHRHSRSGRGAAWSLPAVIVHPPAAPRKWTRARRRNLPRPGGLPGGTMSPRAVPGGARRDGLFSRRTARKDSPQAGDPQS